MLLIDDSNNLVGRAAGLEEDSFKLRVAIKCLLKGINTKSTVSKEMGLSGLKLSKVSVSPQLMVKS